MIRRRIHKSIMAVIVAGLVGGSVGHAARPTTAPLAMAFPALNQGTGIYNDSDGAYVNGGDPGGHTPSVYLDGSNLQFDLTGSTRELCLNFDVSPPASLASPSLFAPSLPRPMTGCYVVQANTLTTAEYGGVANLTVGDSKDFSLVIYWTGIGSDAQAHKFSVAFRNRDYHPVRVTHSDSNTWTFETPYSVGGADGFARVSIYLSGKGGGWNDVGDYYMPFTATATKQ